MSSSGQAHFGVTLGVNGRRYSQLLHQQTPRHTPSSRRWPSDRFDSRLGHTCSLRTPRGDCLLAQLLAAVSLDFENLERDPQFAGSDSVHSEGSNGSE